MPLCSGRTISHFLFTLLFIVCVSDKGWGEEWLRTWKETNESTVLPGGSLHHGLLSLPTLPEFAPRAGGHSGHSKLFKSFSSKGKEAYGKKHPKPSYGAPISHPSASHPALQPKPPSVLCSFVMQGHVFSIQSPRYPQPYPSNVMCHYNIKRLPNTCSVELDVQEFYVEPSPGCVADWLLIGNRKYCGFQHPRKLIVPFSGYNSDLLLGFHSDWKNDFKGFYISGRQLPCPIAPPAIHPPQKPPGVYPPYPPPIYPPVTPFPPYPPPTYTAQPSTFPVTPPTTFTPPQGTSTPPNIPCDLDYNVPQGQFQSLYYPRNYPPNLSCRIRFDPLVSYCTLELFFKDFQLENSPGCSKDAMIVGRNRYCGSSLSGQKVRLDFVLGSPIDLQLITDSNGSGRGYEATFRMLACEVNPTTAPPFTTPPGVTCDRSFRERESFITSVNYPLPYAKNLDCIYTVEKWIPFVEGLEILFVAFDIQDSPGCQADYLEVDGKRYCGVETGRTIRIPFIGSPTFEMRFHSDSAIQSTGFNLRVRQLDQQATTAPTPTTPPSLTCFNQVFQEPSFLMISPQFPLQYRPGQQCTYTVIKASQDVCELQLRFTVFSLPGPAVSCLGDYLEGVGIRMCGELSGQTRRLPFFDSQLLLTFFSDFNDDAALGFSIQAIQLTDCTAPVLNLPPLASLKTEESPCNIALVPTNRDVSSTNISTTRNDPSGFLQCAYQIFPQPGICGVELFLKQFYITPSVNCSQNYMEIENRRFCGQQLENTRVDLGYLVGSGPIRLPFHIRSHAKFVWDFSASPISCSVFKRQCSPSVWRARGAFHYNSLAVSIPYSPIPIECDFIIRKWSRRICRVDLEFVRFHVGKHSNCALNHLDTGGQNVCGKLDGRKITLEFPANEDTLRLPLKHLEEVDLLIDVRQVACH